MASVCEAIERRRSIRKFKADEVPEDSLRELLEAARLAPSGSNSQPWRFKVVKDPAARTRLSAAANGQSFVKEAPVVLACCLDLEGYIEETLANVKAMSESRGLSPAMRDAMISRVEAMRAKSRDDLAANASFNIGIAGEHVALRAVELGLGSCWVKAFDEPAVREVLGLGEEYYVAALIPLGYPDESPPPRRRKSLEEIILP
jgi:nitroreductase